MHTNVIISVLETNPFATYLKERQGVEKERGRERDTESMEGQSLCHDTFHFAFPFLFPYIPIFKRNHPENEVGRMGARQFNHGW